MPYPYHKDMHQRHNADALAESGAAVVAEDQKDSRKNATALRPILESLLYDGEKRKAMSQAAKKLGKPHAAEAVGRVVMELMGKNAIEPPRHQDAKEKIKGPGPGPGS